MPNLVELHLGKSEMKTLDVSFSDYIHLEWNNSKSFLKMSLKDFKGIMIESVDYYHWIYLNFSNYHIAIRYDRDAVFTEKFSENKKIIEQALDRAFEL